MAELAHQRDLFWLSSEGVGAQRRQGEYVTLLTVFQHGRGTERLLAHNHQHGTWLDHGDDA